MSKGSCDISSVLKHRNRVSFAAESLIESKAENYDKALALLMSAKFPWQFKFVCFLLKDSQVTCQIKKRKEKKELFLSPLYLSMMSAMTQANICRPSGSCRATEGRRGEKGKEKSYIRVTATCYLINPGQRSSAQPLLLVHSAPLTAKSDISGQFPICHGGTVGLF